jgi:hypothetical protein
MRLWRRFIARFLVPSGRCWIRHVRRFLAGWRKRSARKPLVAEAFLDLSEEDQREALEYGRTRSGAPYPPAEKDLWVVWTLRALFESPLSADLTFKGGTSPSKV